MLHFFLKIDETLFIATGSIILPQAFCTLHPETQVLYMSAFPASEIVVKEVTQGTAELLKKPFTPTGLLEAVRKSVQHSMARAGQ